MVSLKSSEMWRKPIFGANQNLEGVGEGPVGSKKIHRSKNILFKFFFA